MTDKNTEFGLTIYESESLENHLGRLARGKPFEWHSAEREKEANKHFDAVKSGVRLGRRSQTRFSLQELRGQARLQWWEIAKLTLMDFLERHDAKIAFGKSLSEGHPLNTCKVFITSKAFQLLDVLESYPYPRAFGESGLDLGSIRIGESKGVCVLELEFLGEVCTISC